MSLVANWRRVLQRAWSIRFIAASIVLSALEVGISVFTDDPPLPRATFAALAVAVTIAAAVARIVAQPELHGDDQ